LPATRQRTLLTALIERIEVRANRIDIHFRPTRLRTLLDIRSTWAGQRQRRALLLVARSR